VLVQKAQVIGSGAFQYRFAFVPERERRPNSSAWLLAFYDAVRFLVLIADPNT